MAHSEKSFHKITPFLIMWKKWTVYDVNSGSKFMPVAGDMWCNSGLHLIMLCEAFICGYLPTYDSKMVESICANGHLITSLATGIPLLGKCSLYPVELYNTSRMHMRMMKPTLLMAKWTKKGNLQSWPQRKEQMGEKSKMKTKRATKRKHPVSKIKRLKLLEKYPKAYKTSLKRCMKMRKTW